jgi:ABC-type oligopeptide transport system substrate-binding subunit
LSKKLWTALIVAGLAVLAIFGGTASAAGSKHATGGTINVDMQSDLDYSDPALDYFQPGWELEYATCLKLLNYKDGNGPQSSQLVPEAAAGFPKVTNSGKTYDFTVKAGFTKFSNGQPVTAANFKAAFDRDADPKMQSPAVSFFSDVVGSTKSPVSGVQVRGSHLIIHLTKPAPDFEARVAMPFFCAVPTNLAHDPNGVLAPPSAGPYYIASRIPNKEVVVKKNPYYHGTRPHNVSEIHVNVGETLDATYLRIQQGTTDYADSGIPPATYAEAAQKFGVNKPQVGKPSFYVKPILAVNYFAFNHDRPVFQKFGSNGLGNVALMKAINYAIDRHAILAQGGYLAGKRTDQILPPGMAGFRDANLYPLKAPDVATAKSWLARAGALPTSTLVYYTCNAGTCPLRAQIVQFDLKQIGLNLDIRPFARGVQFTKEGNRGEPYDIADEGWLADYADPYDFINVLLSGDNIHQTNNSNFAYFNSPKYNQLMRQAQQLSGSSRYTNYGNLDINIMKNAAPWAARSNATNRLVLSSHVGNFTYNNIYGIDYAAITRR